MAIVLYHHPFSRASNTVWMLEEVGVDYELRFVDLMTGEQKKPEILALNPMGKLPILVDHEQVVTESAAIGLYLADRYAPGRLAPPIDDPRRGTYLRWSLFAPSVIEPGMSAKTSNWEFLPSRVGWGTYDSLVQAMESAIGERKFLLGDTFSMADIIFGGTIRFMLQFDMLEAKPVFTDYAGRLAERPGLQRAESKNKAIVAERGLAKK